MKLALLVLFGLCTFAVHAQVYPDVSETEDFDLNNASDEITRTQIMENLKKMVEFLRTTAEEMVNDLETKMKNAIDAVVAEIKSFAEKSYAGLENLVGSAQQQLKSNQAIECFDKYRPELSEILQKTRKEIEDTIVGAIAEIYNIKNSVQGNIDAIRGEIQKLRDILKECVKPLNPIFTMKCILKNVKNIQESLKSIVKDAYNATKEAVKELQKIAKKVRSDIEAIVKQADASIRAVLQNIKDCVQKEGEKPSPEEKPEEKPQEKPEGNQEESEDALDNQEFKELLKFLMV